MMRRTDELIQQLAAAATPVERLAHPARRALAWSALAVLYVVAVAVAMRPRADLGAVLHDPAFDASLIAGLVAAVMAAIAAFAMVVPGFAVWRRVSLTAVPLAWFAWFALDACIAGASHPTEIVGWQCMASFLAFGAVPVTAIALMLRRGAPLAPGRTMALGALAAAALADVGARICHTTAGEAHMMWHVAGALLIIAASSYCAPLMLRWRMV